MRGCLLLASAALSSLAHAAPDDLVGRSIVLAPDELRAELTLETGIRPRAAWRPMSLAPDAWLGLTSRVTVGLIHSARSLDQIDVASTWCVRAVGRECDRAYRGSGVDVLVRAHRGAIELVARARLLLRDIDPVKPAITLGAHVRWQSGRIAIMSDPYLRLGLANRAQGNRAAVNLPVWLAVQPTCRWLLAVHLGYDTELAVARDGWHGTFGFIVATRPLRALEPLELGVELGYPSLWGPQNTFVDPMLAITLGWRSSRR